MFRGYSKEPSQRNACFCVFKRIFFVRLGRSVRSEENDNFLIQFYLQANSFWLKLLKARCEMSETRAHFELKRVKISMGNHLVT